MEKQKSLLGSLGSHRVVLSFGGRCNHQMSQAILLVFKKLCINKKFDQLVIE